MRFEEEIIASLLEIAWWDWPFDKITKNLKSIVESDIDALRMLIT